MVTPQPTAILVTSTNLEMSVSALEFDTIKASFMVLEVPEFIVLSFFHTKLNKLLSLLVYRTTRKIKFLGGTISYKDYSVLITHTYSSRQIRSNPTERWNTDIYICQAIEGLPSEDFLSL